MLYIISGLSGSGKSTIAKLISEKTGIENIIQYTTRPIRPGEENGVDYNFITDIEFECLDMLTKERFKVAGGDIWRYGLPTIDKDKNYITVLSPNSIKILEENNVDFVDILVKVNDDERFKRIFDRRDNQKLSEITRRELKDKEIFEKYVPKFEISNEEDVEKVVNKIIKKYLQIK